MTTSIYPTTRNLGNTEKTLLEVVNNLQEIARLRETEDISDFNNLDERFVLGRGRFETRVAPSSPSDVLSTDELGDIVNDSTHEYKLLNISGTGLRWDRRVLDVSW